MKSYRVNGDAFCTPIRTYRRDGQTVTSVSAVHVGRQEYWDAVQKEMDRIAIGLYEGVSKGVGGGSDDEFLKVLDDLKDFATNCLGGTFQNGVLTYPTAWENAYISTDDFSADESMRRRAAKFRGLAEDIKKLYEKYPEEIEGIIGRGFLFLSRYGLLSNAFFLGVGRGYRKILEQERNEVLIERIDSKLRTDIEELGIVYGAGHLKAIDRYLRNSGFGLEDEKWLVALDFSNRMPFWKSLMSIRKKSRSKARQKRVEE